MTPENSSNGDIWRWRRRVITRRGISGATLAGLRGARRRGVGNDRAETVALMGRAARFPLLTTALVAMSGARLAQLSATAGRSPSGAPVATRVGAALRVLRSCPRRIDAESIAHDMRTGEIISCLVALGSTGYQHDAALVDVLESELQDRPTWAPTT